LDPGVAARIARGAARALGIVDLLETHSDLLRPMEKLGRSGYWIVLKAYVSTTGET
jgi:hypothetical protein